MLSSRKRRSLSDFLNTTSNNASSTTVSNCFFMTSSCLFFFTTSSCLLMLYCRLFFVYRVELFWSWRLYQRFQVLWCFIWVWQTTQLACYRLIGISISFVVMLLVYILWLFLNFVVGVCKLTLLLLLGFGFQQLWSLDFVEFVSW